MGININNNTDIKRVAYCAGMDPEDYNAASSIAEGAARIDFPNYAMTYESVVSGDCDVCILPFEKSRTGQVAHVMDLFYKGDLSIIKVFKWNTGNETVRYAILSRDGNETAHEDGSRFMMIFTVQNVQGSLVKAINAISSNGYNIRFLHTRPLGYEEWGYYFYTECDGDDTSEQGRKMIADLAAVCLSLKLVGRYPNNRVE